MGIDDNYCLQLNRFEENAKLCWQEFQIEKDFCDVTMACEDKQIKAHKLIISSCSPVLRNILKLNQTVHPVIYLGRVKYSDLQNLLNFMYQGEAYVAEEDLSCFLKIAEDLDVRGLCKRNPEVTLLNGEATSQVTDQKVHSSSKQRNENERVENINCRNGDSLENINDNNYYSSVKINSSNDKSLENINYNNEDNFLIKDTDIKTLITPRKNLRAAFNPVCIENNKQNDISAVVVQNAGRSHQCGQCNYSTINKSNLTKHIKSIHEGERYPCAECNYKATEKSSLAQHINSIHKGKRYPCDRCNYKATTKADLIIHIKSIHECERHPCTQCSYKATFKSSLTKHVQSIHDGVCYPCDQCDYTATRTDQLRCHQLKYHNL